MNADFVPRDLVGAAAGVFGLGGGQAVCSLDLRTLAGAAGSASAQLLFVGRKVFLNAVQFTAQIVLLPRADGCQFRSKVRPDGFVEGYQADITREPKYCGALYDETPKRGLTCDFGEAFL